jgi:radical SAM protein with 4Fe4S-binding SPASM domain
MDYFELVDGVFIVNGQKKHCIYDLNTCKLFSINEMTLNQINLFVSEGFNYLCLKNEQLKLFDSLIRQNIIQKSKRDLNNKGALINVYDKTFIDFAWIEVIQHCNLECLHCYESSTINKKSEMSINFFELAINQLVENNVSKIQLIGGEPFLLGPKLEIMMAYVKDKFDFVEIFTNGTLINTHWVNILKNNNINNIALSIYSYIEGEHDKVTKQKGSFKKTVNNLRLLNDNMISTRIACIKMNNVSIGEKTDHLFSLDKFDNVRLTGRGTLGLYNKELIQNKLITKETFTRPLDKQFVLNNFNNHNCFSNRIYIDVDLNVYPCVMERRKTHGNLRDTPLSQVIDLSISRCNKDKIETCKVCEYRYACFDCRPDSLGREFHEKPWYCTYNPFKGEWEDCESAIYELIGKEEVI